MILHSSFNKLTLQSFQNQHFVNKLPNLGNGPYKVNKNIFKECQVFHMKKFTKIKKPSFNIFHRNIFILIMFAIFFRLIHDPGGEIK